MGLHRPAGLQWVSTGMVVSDGTCRSLKGHICLRSGMSFSDEACQVSDQACRSPMGLRKFSDRSPIMIIFP